MKLAALLRRAACLVAVLAPLAGAQSWRETSAGLGATARVLIIGAHPDDEDNAAMAWLSLGRNVETAFLSLTRGESGVNIAGNERQSALGVVRTAELLAERERDGAHQYFTRAYDFGPARSDSVIDRLWPHDTLLKDVVSVIRAFRPHVIISLSSDSAERDPAHRLVARLAREAFSAAADTVRFPSIETSRLPAWSVSRLLTRVDSACRGGVSGVDINVGEFDPAAGRSYAEIGAEIRRLQRTQPPPPSPPVGVVWRHLRIDSSRVRDGAAGLFGALDTTWGRFRDALPASAGSLDSLTAALADVRRLARSAPRDQLATSLARVVKRIADLRAAFDCPGGVVPRCAARLGDLAVSLDGVRQHATRALLQAAGVVIDGTVGRAVVASRDSVSVAVSVYNGGTVPLVIRRLVATSRTASVPLVRDSAVIAADSTIRWAGNVPVRTTDLPWWQINGLIQGTWLHDIFANHEHVFPQLVSGEDRLPSSGVEATIVVGGVDIPVVQAPLVYRAPGIVRGDNRHPLTGVMRLSVLLERTAEYERAGLPIDRLFRVFLTSPLATPDTVTAMLELPAGLTADSATRTAILPPFGSKILLFRLRGKLKPGSDTLFASAHAEESAIRSRPSGSAVAPRALPKVFGDQGYEFGVIWHDFPHIPSQQFLRSSKVRIEAVDIRIPSKLRIAYVKGSDDLQPPLGQLQVNVQALDPSLLSIVDLSGFTTVLIGADAMANDALAGAVPDLQDFMRKGGTVVVLPGHDEIPHSGLLPFPVTFDTVPVASTAPDAPVRLTDPQSPLLRWPNVITPRDFDDWSGERARNVPITFDSRYHTVLSTGDADQPPTAATILVAPLGKGRLIYTSLSFDKQLAAVNAGAARLFINLLSAGLNAPASTATTLRSSFRSR
jgi:LmbE family N-acetylglucosaminyl deacetylase